MGWEPEDSEGSVGTLEVEFRSGHVYRYRDVPEAEYMALVGAGSVGRYMASEIIGNFSEERVR